MNTKSRQFQDMQGSFERSEDSGKTWIKVNDQKVIMGSQVTDSEGHPTLPNGERSGGGPFYTSRVLRSFPTKNVSFSSGSQRLHAAIGVPLEETMLPVKYRNLPPISFRSKDTHGLDPYGAEAISQVAPTNPNANLGVALAELHREKLPSLPGIQTWRRRLELIRAAGSEFLNVEFGWLPLLSDVKDTSSSIRNSRDILNQYSRDSGKNVRREFSFPIEKSEETNTIGPASATTIILGPTGWPGFWSSIFGPVSITQSIKVETRKWFSGAFTYALPDRGDAWSGMHRAGAEADKLFGITPTPDVLWELTPWSWAADWFTNTGDVIHNVTNFALQGLVMRYGYMMEEKTVTITHSFASTGASPLLNLKSLPPSSIEFRSKVRTAANPFGFGVTSSSLSATQVAIAVALGITLL